MEINQREKTGQFHYELLDAIWQSRRLSHGEGQYFTYEKCDNHDCTCGLYRLTNRFDPEVAAYNKANPIRYYTFDCVDLVCDQSFQVKIKARCKEQAIGVLGESSNIEVISITEGECECDA